MYSTVTVIIDQVDQLERSIHVTSLIEWNGVVPHSFLREKGSPFINFEMLTHFIDVFTNIYDYCLLYRTSVVSLSHKTYGCAVFRIQLRVTHAIKQNPKKVLILLWVEKVTNTTILQYKLYYNLFGNDFTLKTNILRL